MFTGIVQALGTVTDVAARSGGLRLTVSCADLLPADPAHAAQDAAQNTGRDAIELGESISVSGACLTVTESTGSDLVFDLSSETVERTTLGALHTGATVNLERALALGDRLGGHLVSGHVDGIGRLVERRPDGNSERFTFTLPSNGGVTVIEKGSVAVDGISLTSWDCRGARFSVAVIPHTLAATTLGQRRVGDRVNLEQDQIGRWVAAMAQPYRG